LDREHGIRYSSAGWTRRHPRDEGYRQLLVSDPLDFALEPDRVGRLAVATAVLPVSGARLHHVTSSGHMIEAEDTTSLTIMMPVVGALGVETASADFRVTAGESLTLRPSRRRTRVAGTDREPFEAIMLKVPASVFETTDGETFPRSGSDFAAVEDTSRATGPLRDFLRYLFGDIASPDSLLRSRSAGATAESLLWEHFRAFLAKTESAVSTVVQRSPSHMRTVWSAIDFMRAHYSEPISVSDIAAAVGTGPRNLQDAFRSCGNRTPMAMLSAIRMENVRLGLMTTDQSLSVTHIAMNCGFTHMGRFAKAYRDIYGEAPSQTRRKR
jgi:AraC-like DNA-binding protein